MTGVVRDANGRPLRGIPVGIDSEETPPLSQFGEAFLQRVTRTDADGRFTFAPLPAGRYRVDANECLIDKVGRQIVGRPLPGFFDWESVVVHPDKPS